MKMDRSDGGGRAAVVAIECVAGGSKAEEWSGAGGETAAPQTGDILEEVTFGGSPPVQAPFKGGRAGIMKYLHSAFKRGDTSVLLKARRGGEPSAVIVELHACVVPHPPAGRRQYLLRSIRDPNYAVGLVDRSESECIALQNRMFQGSPHKAMGHGRYSREPLACHFLEIARNVALGNSDSRSSPQRSRSSRVVCVLSNTQVQDGYVSYPWEKKMRESLRTSNSSCFLSMLILPKASDPSGTRYSSLEDTLSRANAWFNSSQASGVPIAFSSLQTEALLTKISGETASSTVNMGSLADLSNLANVSLYGFEDYHGVDIGVVRAVRLWYTPKAGEVPLEIMLQEGDTKLGFAISRTEEGFIYISSVTDDNNSGVAAARSGLKELFKEASEASKLLVISRVGDEKVLPWMVSTSGAIRCFDTVSLSQKLSLHRHALKPILLHLLMWETPPSSPTSVAKRSEATTPLSLPFELSPTSSFVPPPPVDKVLQDLVYRGGAEGGLTRDTAGDVSFRFHNFSNTRNWV
ncbi:hypothetical protein MUK42_29241 [Musa troglodytarum]|uniref:Uncharacterized protein n=1 Tax=Musa troglodytarum TaxID=320322 RepID=A0A9E7JXS4_9LILI|nr:hypothetical protein MUK42_29241 [Musa troglodytarum]